MSSHSAPPHLGARVPGQAVIEELLALQGKVPPRSTLQRILGMSPLSAESSPWYRGALGELVVGEILENLGPEWLVLHAVPVGAGSSDIDHVLIGPAGVFTINTKNHSGQSVWVAGRTLMVAGRKTRHLYNAAHEAARASKLLTAAAGLPVKVTAVVVIVEPKTLTIKARPEQAVVVTDAQLARWLRRSSPVLAWAELARISGVAVQPGTWHKRPAAQNDPQLLQQNFDALRHLVVQARRRRAAWALGVPAVTLLALMNGASLCAAILHRLAGH
ncbi:MULTISPECIES: nuclease-related domain-containing protein [unclassified Arthrobacter]|uniref:nuclease-related domain-containing protein n=1 Tax=unclassified Arthrobacter TaxID=235627 RepID=UPI001F2794CD|nr:nuclease-related domain-containing protein [Arthrobacter sp. FW306-07-I]UKA73804.1 NERD domain-containing protein [Arthrobacter sp. FW306-07-I]